MVLRIFTYFYTPEGVVTGVKKLAADCSSQQKLDTKFQKFDN